VRFYQVENIPDAGGVLGGGVISFTVSSGLHSSKARSWYCAW